MTVQGEKRPLFDPPIVRQALIEALQKLHPWHQVRNPVMFVVLVGGVCHHLPGAQHTEHYAPGHAAECHPVGGDL